MQGLRQQVQDNNLEILAYLLNVQATQHLIPAADISWCEVAIIYDRWLRPIVHIIAKPQIGIHSLIAAVMAEVVMLV